MIIFESIHTDDLKPIGEATHRVVLSEIDQNAVDRRNQDYLRESVDRTTARDNGSKVEQEVGAVN